MRCARPRQRWRLLLVELEVIDDDEVRRLLDCCGQAGSLGLGLAQLADIANDDDVWWPHDFEA